VGGCGKCLLVQNPDSEHPDWTAVVMKKNRCPPWSNGCGAGEPHFDVAAPGFDNLKWSTANVCGLRSGTGFESQAQSEAVGNWWSSCGNTAECAQLCDNLPQEFQKGCKLFASWGWKRGDPGSVKFKAVACPAEFVQHVGAQFGTSGVEPSSTPSVLPLTPSPTLLATPRPTPRPDSTPRPTPRATQPEPEPEPEPETTSAPLVTPKPPTSAPTSAPTLAPSTPAAVVGMMCGAYDAGDCRQAHRNANGNYERFCNRCLTEGGASPLRGRCNLCCAVCSGSSFVQKGGLLRERQRRGLLIKKHLFNDNVLFQLGNVLGQEHDEL